MNHIAAIHTLKTKMKMSDADYRALLMSLEGKDSCKAMSALQLARVRTHFCKLAVKMGVTTPEPMLGKKPAPMRRTALQRSGSDAHDERWNKARALWASLAQAGIVKFDSDEALLAYVKRQTRMEAWRFCNGYQINSVIESLKNWCARVGVQTSLG